MPVSCDASDAPALVRYAFVGKWAAHELVERRRELIRAGKLTPDSAVLFDLRPATTIPRRGDPDTALESSAADAVWPVRRAFVVNTQAHDDAARRLQALLAPLWVVNEIFQEESDALERLASRAGRTR